MLKISPGAKTQVNLPNSSTVYSL